MSGYGYGYGLKKGRVGWGQDGDLKLGQKTQVQKNVKKGRQKKEERKKRG